MRGSQLSRANSSAHAELLSTDMLPVSAIGSRMVAAANLAGRPGGSRRAEAAAIRAPAHMDAPQQRREDGRARKSETCQKQTLGSDGLLRCCGRFFDQCRYLGRVRKKDRVAARKFNDLRLRPLRHESLEVRIDHSVLHGNYCVAGLLFPSRNCGLRLQCITRNRYLGYRHKTRDRLRSVCSEITRKRIGVDCQKAIANWSDALGSRWHFVCQIRQTLADVWLDGRYINKSFDVGMHSRLGDDHPAITVADQYTRTCPIDNAARRSHVCRETRLRLLHN